MIIFVVSVLLFYFFYLVCKNFLNVNQDNTDAANTDNTDNKCQNLLGLLDCNNIDYDGNCVNGSDSNSRVSINVNISICFNYSATRGIRGGSKKKRGNLKKRSVVVGISG